MGLLDFLWKRSKDQVKQQSKAPKYFRGTGGQLPPGAPPYSRWQQIPKEHIEEAVSPESLYVFVQSSNVLGVQYFMATQQMQVDYINGQSWLYDNVSEGEARDFFASGSKGEWIWSHIRIRGTVHGHQKPAKRLK